MDMNHCCNEELMQFGKAVKEFSVDIYDAKTKKTRKLY